MTTLTQHIDALGQLQRERAFLAGTLACTGGYAAYLANVGGSDYSWPVSAALLLVLMAQTAAELGRR